MDKRDYYETLDISRDAEMMQSRRLIENWQCSIILTETRGIRMLKINSKRLRRPMRS